MLFSSRVRVRIEVRIRFSAWLVSCCAHVLMFTDRIISWYTHANKDGKGGEGRNQCGENVTGRLRKLFSNETCFFLCLFFVYDFLV